MATIEAIKRNGKIIFPLTTINAVVDNEGNNISIPTKISDLTNDKGYLTEHQSLDAYTKKSELSTINGQSLLNGGNITISGTSESAGLSGKLSLADLEAVKAAQNGLRDNEVRFYVIADSEGRLPSKEKCYDVDTDVIRQLSLTTGNSVVDSLISSVEVEPIGVSVGDLIAITKVPVAISDLAANFGISIPLSGTISIHQYKILHTNSARIPGTGSSSLGVEGLLNGYDKMVFENSSKPTKYSYGTPLNDCLKSGVLAYTSDTISGITANWSIFVDCAATPDGGGYYHLLQKAVCRDNPNTGRIFERFGYYHESEVIPPTFTAWKECGGVSAGEDSSSAGLIMHGYMTDFEGQVEFGFDEALVEGTGFVIRFLDEEMESMTAYTSVYGAKEDQLIVFGMDKIYIFYSVSTEDIEVEVIPTYSEVYATKDYVNSLIVSTLNTPI